MNLALIILNSWLAFKQYFASKRQSEYERKPSVIVGVQNIGNNVGFRIENQGSIPANRLALAVEADLGEGYAKVGTFSLDSLNPKEATEHDISEELFSLLERRKAMNSDSRDRPTGEEDESGEAIVEEYFVHHLERSQVRYLLKVTGNYGTDINPQPIFALDYRFQVILNQLDYSGGQDYTWSDDFQTKVVPQTGLWVRSDISSPPA